MSTSDIIKRYTDYRVKNSQIKRRQRLEREAELTPYLEDLGREIVAEQSAGNSLVYISELISLKNRAFLYSAINAYKALSGPTTPPAPTTAPGATTTTPEPTKAPQGGLGEVAYTITPLMDYGAVPFYTVEIPLYGTYTLTVDGAGNLELPYEWLHESIPAKKTLFRKIVQEIDA